MKEKIERAFKRMDEYQQAIWEEAYYLKKEINAETKSCTQITSTLYNLYKGLGTIIDATSIIETTIDINKKPF